MVLVTLNKLGVLELRCELLQAINRATQHTRGGDFAVFFWSNHCIARCTVASSPVRLVFEPTDREIVLQ